MYPPINNLEPGITSLLLYTWTFSHTMVQDVPPKLILKIITSCASFSAKYSSYLHVFHHNHGPIAEG
jgi:hypothetical protein